MQKEFTYRNKKICYTDTGQGNAVVLLHGFGEDSGIWQQQLLFLQPQYRVIIPDLPGSGKSAMLEDILASMEEYANCVNALAEKELQQQKCVLLGHSMGGYITLAFAKLFPQKLKGFGLIHSTAFADSEEKKQTRLRGIEMMAEYGAGAFLKNTIPNLFSASFKQNEPQQMEALIEKGKNFTIEALQQYYRAMIDREDTTDVLRKAIVPVLFIMGTEDVAAPLNDVLKLCYLPAQSHIHILNGVGHMGMLEAVDEVNGFVASFLEALQ